jgi:inorganic triphosphatase YgiF
LHTQIVERADGEHWERDILGPQPDLAAARRTTLEPFLEALSREDLRRVFRVRMRQTPYAVKWMGAAVTVTVERGTLASSGRHASFAMLDIAAQESDARSVFSLAKTLNEMAPLRIAIQSLTDVGYALFHGDGAAATKATSVHLGRSLSTGEAFRTIARGCLTHLLANEAAMLAGEGEALHQMRVAGSLRLLARLGTSTSSGWKY